MMLIEKFNCDSHSEFSVFVVVLFYTSGKVIKNANYSYVFEVNKKINAPKWGNIWDERVNNLDSAC